MGYSQWVIRSGYSQWLLSMVIPSYSQSAAAILTATRHHCDRVLPNVIAALNIPEHLSQLITNVTQEFDRVISLIKCANGILRDER